MFRLSEMIRALTGKEIQGNDCNFSEAVRDSHEAAVGTLFVAIPGERTDGHKFIPNVIEQKCAAIVVEKDVTDIPDAHEGSLCTLIGRDGGCGITMEELGDLSGRFNYELACDINSRVPRIVCGGSLG